MVIDFGVLPPEINSGRMHTGPGSAPMASAAEAWDALAAEMHHAAARYSSVLSGLIARWQGASSVTMAAAAAPYLAWMTATAVQAEQTASQARAAAAAYEIAFAATVAPAAVTANRAQLLALIATNFFGQNTPAIMATQAQYIEMWAQDAAAMYAYAGSSASASHLMPFSSPPRTTEPAGIAGQATAVAQATGAQAGAHAQTLPQLMSAVSSSLQTLAAPAAATSSTPAPESLASALNTILGFGNGPLSPLSYFGAVGAPELLGAQSYLLPQTGVNLAEVAGKLGAMPAVGGMGLPGPSPGALGSAVTAGMGRAGFVGGLSVPQGWAMAAPAVKPVAAVLTEAVPAGAPVAAATPGGGTLFGSMALSGLAGRAIAGTGGTAARSAGAIGGAASGEAAGAVNIFVIPFAPTQ